MIDLLGYAPIAAAGFAVPQFLPQIRKLRATGDSVGVSPSWAALTSVNNAAWIAYFTMARYWTALVPSSSATLLAGTLAVMLLRRQQPRPRPGPQPGRAAALIGAWAITLAAAGVAGGRAGLGALLTVAFLLQVTPSVWTAYRTVRPTGICSGTWLLILGELTCWMIFGLHTADPRLITLGASGIIVSVLMLARIHRTTGHRRSALPATDDPGVAMQISGSVALVSGANRGLGRAFARELVRRGAAKVYGAARDPAAVTEPGVLPVALDITDADQVARVAAQCADVSLLVNNAGVMRASTFTSAPDLDAARLEMETNYFGTLRMCRAFAPVLAAAGGGAIVNMLSITSFFTNPFNASYGASKAAEWSLTNGVRIELHHQGTLVVAVHAGFIDTEMAALTNAPKISPESVAQQVFNAVEVGQIEVLADERTRDCQGRAVPRPRAHLPAHPGILGRRGQRHQLTLPS